MSVSQIDPEEVERLFLECSCQNGKNVDKCGRIVIAGVSLDFSFIVEKLTLRRVEIIALINKLPKEFQRESGASLLRAFYDEHGEIWTESISRVEQLLLLGMAIGVLRYAYPRNYWMALPKKMPYYTTRTENKPSG